MCGFVTLASHTALRDTVADEVTQSLLAIQHRGPDFSATKTQLTRQCVLGQNRLSVIDLSDQGRQPMSDSSGRYWIVFNGEIYNYLELRSELYKTYHFKTQTDTEVLLASFIRWGRQCLDKLLGMFSFIIWDERERVLFAARDRFGVKPFYYATTPTGEFIAASEIKAIHKFGIAKEVNAKTWATYLTYGLHDHGEKTFWKGINKLLPGHFLRWKDGHIKTGKWYDLVDYCCGDYDLRTEAEVVEEYRLLLEDSIRLRFRSDVPVGINLSGGLDSSILLGLVHAIRGRDSDVTAFTFYTDDENYDELPWVHQMLAKSNHLHRPCLLQANEVPELAAEIQRCQDEPFGGLPTIAYSKIFKRARQEGVIVLLDGQGLDEQWAGYDYYRTINYQLSSHGESRQSKFGSIQGSASPSTRPDCLIPEFRQLASSLTLPRVLTDDLRRLQYRDTCLTKIPRALRFNDRVSMLYSTELREPFLDHRLFELALKQPQERKIRNNIHKWLLRKIAVGLLPDGLIEAPKRALQTPQREWLRGPLRDWTENCIGRAQRHYGGIWIDSELISRELQAYQRGESDNSFYVWQWISLGLMLRELS